MNWLAVGVAQKAETKRLSEEIATVTEKLDAVSAVGCRYSRAVRCRAGSTAESPAR
jgi:hypothetical protein